MGLDKPIIYDGYECALFRKTHAKYGEFSNMASGFPLLVNDFPIRTTEALYQACRFPHLPDVQRLIIDQKSPMAAKMHSKTFRDTESRSNWEEIRVRIMRWCLRIKLAQHWSRFGEILLSTETKDIVEVSDKDDFWGAIPQQDNMLIGKNALGRLLVELRSDLRKPTAENLKRVEPVPITGFLLFGEVIRAVDAPDVVCESLTDPDATPTETSLWRIVNVE